MSGENSNGSNEAQYQWHVRLDTICDQFEAAWRAGRCPLIEETLPDLAGAQRAELLAELLPLEIEWRVVRGETPVVDEYLARFPEQAALVSAAFRPLDSGLAAGSSSGAGHRAATTRYLRSNAPARVSILPVNTRIGDYELLEEIGRGGMGVVYRARQISLERVVAVKMILAGEFAGRREIDRFRSEARAVARLHHPHIVPIYEVGEEAGRQFYSMPFIDGASLADLLAQGPLPPLEAARLIATVAEAVAYAHSQGIIHRDLKPANVLIDRAGAPHITDFGLARRTEIDGMTTTTNQIVGTVGFMPPEQARNDSAAVGPQSDVYSLGAILYTLLTGRPPFLAASLAESLHQVIDGEPPSPRRLNSAIPGDLEVICMKCLENQPSQRCPSAAFLAAELTRYLNHEPIVSRKLGRAALAWRWCRRRPAAAAIVALSFIGVALFLIGIMVRDRDLTEFNSQLSGLNQQLAAKAREAEAARRSAEQSEQQTADILYGADMRLAANALRDYDLRTVTALLDRHLPHRPGNLDRRGFEWHYLHRLATAEHGPLLEPGSPQYCAVYSPDHAVVAAAGRDAVVRLLAADRGEPIRQIETGQIEVNGVAFSPDGEELATTGDDGSVCLWNVATGVKRLTIERANPDHVFQVVFVPRTRLLACCGEDGLIRLFDVQTGQPRGQLSGHSRTIEALALGEDGETLVSVSSDETAKIWDVRNQKMIGSLPCGYRASSATIDVRRNLVVTGTDDGKVQTWRLNDMQLVSTKPLFDGASALALDRNQNRLAVGDRGGAIRIWKIDSDGQIAGDPQTTWQAHNGTVHSLAWSSGGTRLLSAGHDGRVVDWGLSGEAGFSRVEIETTGTGSIPLVPDSTLFVRSSSEGLEVWDWKTAGRVVKLDDRWCVAVDIAAGARALAGWQSDGTLVIRDTDRWKILAERNFGGWQNGFAISPDGRTVAVSRHNRRNDLGEGERSVCIYDGQTAEFKFDIPAPSCSQVAFAPDSDRLAISQDDGQVLLWSLSRKELWRAPQTAIRALAFSPDGKRLVAGCANREAVVWDAEGGAVRDRLVNHRASIEAVAISPDGRTIATGAIDGVVKLWCLSTGQELFDLHHADTGCRMLGFTNDGKHLAALFGYNLLLVFHGE